MLKEAALSPHKATVIKAKIAATAARHGYEVYAVGGYVRDLLLGRQAKDLDVVAVKDSDGVNAGINLAGLVARDYHLHDPVTFPRFGTAKIDIDGEEVEFVAPRKEKYDPDSRKPMVERGTLEDDARRRDFTVNALYEDLATGKILDPTGHGLQDIKDKVIRVADPEDPDVIFSEDPLRSLRAVRQSYALGFTMDEKTREAITRVADRLPVISMERVRDEFFKILKGPNPSAAIRMLRDLGLQQQIVPEFNAMFDEQGKEIPHGTSPWHDETIFQHTMNALDRTEDRKEEDDTQRLEDMLVALLHDVAKPETAAPNAKGHTAYHGHDDKGAEVAARILERLKAPRELIDRVVFRILNHMRPHDYSSEWSEKAINKFIKDMGSNLGKVLEFARIDSLSLENKNPQVIQDEVAKADELEGRIREKQDAGVDRVLKGKPLLSGDDLKSMFSMPPGAWIGEVHRHLADLQLENPDMTREQAEAAARDFMEKNRMQEDTDKEASACSCGHAHCEGHARPIIVGTCGFNHARWAGAVYPKGTPERDKLLYFARHIPSVEINATTHLMPSRRVFERWAACTPPEFKFSFRVLAGRGLANTLKLLASRALTTLGPERIGAVCIIVPAGLRYHKGEVKAFHECQPEFRYAFDLQSPGWVNETVYEEIRACGGTIVRDHLMGGKIESSWDYVRLPLRAALRDAGAEGQLKVFASDHVLDPQHTGDMYVYMQDEDDLDPIRTVKDLLNIYKRKYQPSPVDLTNYKEKWLGPTNPGFDSFTGPNNSALPQAGSDGGHIYGPIHQQEEEAVDVRERKLKKPGNEELTPTTTFDFADGTTNTENKVDKNY